MLFRSVSQSRYGLVLNDGLWLEFYYECSLHDISLDANGEWELSIEFVPVVGDVITINEKEFKLADIDEGVVTLKRGDEIRYYSFCDIEHDIMNGYWISSVCQQVRSPSVKRKLEVYEVQDSVYLYNSLPCFVWLLVYVVLLFIFVAFLITLQRYA